MAPPNEQFYKASKNKNVTADDRELYHRNAPNNRYKRDVQEITRLLKKYTPHATVTKDSGIIIMSCGTKSAAHQFSALLNRFAYKVETTEGRIARQKNDIYVLITFKHFQLILTQLTPDLADLSKIKTAQPSALTQSITEDSLFVYGEKISVAERKAYHDQNPDRFRRDSNALKGFFNKYTNFIENKATQMVGISIVDKEERHGIIRALNNFSYLVSDDEGKTAMSENSVISMPQAYYKILKPHFSSLVIEDQRRVMQTTSADEKRKYHEQHPERKKPDTNALMAFINELNSKNKLSIEYADNDKAKNIYASANRCAYFIDKDAIVEKNNTTVSVLNQNIFNELLAYFSSTLTNNFCLENMTNSAHSPLLNQQPTMTESSQNTKSQPVKNLIGIKKIYKSRKPQVTPASKKKQEILKAQALAEGTTKTYLPAAKSQMQSHKTLITNPIQLAYEDSPQQMELDKKITTLFDNEIEKSKNKNFIFQNSLQEDDLNIEFTDPMGNLDDTTYPNDTSYAKSMTNSK